MPRLITKRTLKLTLEKNHAGNLFDVEKFLPPAAEVEDLHINKGLPNSLHDIILKKNGGLIYFYNIYVTLPIN